MEEKEGGEERWLRDVKRRKEGQMGWKRRKSKKGMEMVNDER